MKISTMNMKKLLLVLFGIFLLIPSSADSINEESVSMVSFSQPMLENHAYISLKNNTAVKIKNVAFQIVYHDRNGNDIDYKKYYREVTIDPGMTKRLEIPSFEGGDSFSYYGENPLPETSNVDFKLIGYNIDKDSELLEDADKETFITPSFLPLFIIVAVIAIIINIGLYVIVGLMAKNRNRSAALWILLSFIATPFLMIIVLLCIGNNNKYSYENE